MGTNVAAVPATGRILRKFCRATFAGDVSTTMTSPGSSCGSWVLPVLIEIKIEPCGGAFAPDRSEYDNVARSDVNVDVASLRQHLHERGFASYGENTCLLYRAFDSYALAVILFDENRNLWRLQVFVAEVLGQIDFQLMRCFSRSPKLADERVVDDSGISDLHAPRKIRDLEDLDVEHVKRPDFIGAIPRCRDRCEFIGGLG